MEIQTESHDGADLIRVRGKLDYNSANEFDEAIRQLSDEGRSRFIVLDFSEVTALSSPSLRALLSLAKRVKRLSGRLVVAAPSDIALECLNISGFLRLSIFEVKEDPAAAFTELQQHARRQPAAAQPARPSADAKPAPSQPARPARAVNPLLAPPGTSPGAGASTAAPAHQPNPLLAATTGAAKAKTNLQAKPQTPAPERQPEPAPAPSPNATIRPTSAVAHPVTQPAPEPANAPAPAAKSAPKTLDSPESVAGPKPAAQAQPTASSRPQVRSASPPEPPANPLLAAGAASPGFKLGAPAKLASTKPAQPAAKSPAPTTSQPQATPNQTAPRQPREPAPQQAGTGGGLGAQLKEAVAFWLGSLSLKKSDPQQAADTRSGSAPKPASASVPAAAVSKPAPEADPPAPAPGFAGQLKQAVGYWLGRFRR